MPSNQSSTDTSQRRPRGDMYLRAEQRYQAETAAARLTEILTGAVPGMYEQAPDGSPPPAFETLATTTSVATSPDGLVAAAPSTVVVDLSFMTTPAQIAGTIAPPDEALVAPAIAVLVPAAEEANAPVSAAPAPTAVPIAPSPAARVEAPVTPPGPPTAPTVASPFAPPSTAVAPTATSPVAPTVATRVAPAAARVPAQRRRRASLVPASVFGVIALAALAGIASMFWPSRADTPAQSSASIPVLAAKVRTSAPPATGRILPDANRAVQVTPPAIAGTAAQGPANAVVTNGTGKVDQADRPGLTNQPRRADITAPARPSTPVQQARADVAPDRPAAVTPVHTASEGELRITSTPSGARVTVNGIGWGQTPLTLAHLPLGPKTVRVTQDGYASQQRVVDLRGDTASAAVHVALRPAE